MAVESPEPSRAVIVSTATTILSTALPPTVPAAPYSQEEFVRMIRADKGTAKPREARIR